MKKEIVRIEGKTILEIAKATGLHRTTIIYRHKHGLPVYAPRSGELQFCRNGHEYNEENTYIRLVERSSGDYWPQRYCRTCRTENTRKVRQKAREKPEHENPLTK